MAQEDVEWRVCEEQQRVEAERCKAEKQTKKRVSLLSNPPDRANQR